jgi:hypothetical protein
MSQKLHDAIEVVELVVLVKHHGASAGSPFSSSVPP